MKYIITSIMLGVMSIALKAQNVHIPDPNLKSELVYEADIDGDGEVSFQEASNVNYLSIDWVSDLTGLEAFTELMELTIDFVNTDIFNHDFQHNSKLTRLEIRDGMVEEINLIGLPNLTHLHCVENIDLESIDLSQMPLLESLVCYYNLVPSLDLSHTPLLRELYCSQNQFTTLDLSHTPHLERLVCNHNQLSSLDLSVVPNLTWLNCGNNPFTTLDLSHTPHLERLECYQNQLSSLDLSYTTDLTFLNCSENPIGSLDLSFLSNLGYLSCNNNQLATLNLSHTPLLRELYCSHNQFSTLDLSHTPLLEKLKCTHNSISTLDLSIVPNLESLYCKNNQLTSINLANLSVLDVLHCQNNQLANLDLSFLPNLRHLYCYNNQLSSLNLSHLTNLVHLRCGNNNLTFLDLSTNLSLGNLYCSHNDLYGLDLRNVNYAGMGSYSVDFRNNPNLTCVSVDDPVWCSTNWSNVDPQTQFSTNCGNNFKINIDTIVHGTCIDSGYAVVSGTGGVPPYTYQWKLDTVEVGTDSILHVSEKGIYGVTITDNVGSNRTKGVWIDLPGNLGVDVQTNLITTEFRPGRTSTVKIDAFNDGCIPVSGSVSFTFSGPVSFESASTAPDSINGNRLVWNFSNWDYLTPHFRPTIFLKVDTTAMSGDLICLETAATTPGGDTDTTNNIDRGCFEVVNSYDPNDIQVSPIGSCDDHFTEKDEVLTYTIRFQNTGTASAIDIHILDTLDANLDMTTFNLVSTSHSSLITEVLEDSILKFRWNNIHLPDSNSDLAGSQGYVIFEITPKPSVATGTVIENRAAIYFDFNPPVITNTVFNTLVDSLPTVMTEITISACDSFSLNGQQFDTSGVYDQVLTSAGGCDSTLRIYLTIHNSMFVTEDITACDSAIINGTSYFSSQVIVDTLSTLQGCDSVVTTHLTIYHSTVVTIDSTILEGESIMIDGNLETEEGNYHEMYNTNSGCDSMVVWHLRVTTVNGIEDYPFAHLSIYPNPFKDMVLVQGLLNSSGVEVKVFNVIGQEQELSYRKVGEGIELITNDWEKGIYFLELKKEQQQEVIKLIKQ